MGGDILRSEALWNGTIIGIESIYTVIDGKQINKPKELKELRAKSKNRELFCPCGCGHNLVLVAGDKNLRAQHFRELNSWDNQACTYKAEGRTSVWSKIVLQCWLEDKVHPEDLKARVPLCEVDDNTRKYEFSFLSQSSKLAVNYCRGRENLSDEKLRLLDNNSVGIHIIHIVDIENGNTNGQYPEGLMKVQERQGYCLLLQVDSWEYAEASMKAVFYAKDIDGIWHEETFAEGKLSEYGIVSDGELWLNQNPLSKALLEAQDSFATALTEEQKRREAAIALREEQERKRKAEEERLREERRKWLEEQEKEQARREAEAEQRRKERERLEQIEAERIEQQRKARERQEQIEREQAEAERKLREDAFKNDFEAEITQQEHLVIDPEGNRWIRCQYCGKTATTSSFMSYGGAGSINLGICYDCREIAAREAKEKRLIHKEQKKDNVTKENRKCPDCGAKLVERKGPFGSFLGCERYPNCRYSCGLK